MYIKDRKQCLILQIFHFQIVVQMILKASYKGPTQWGGDEGLLGSQLQNKEYTQIPFA